MELIDHQRLILHHLLHRADAVVDAGERLQLEMFGEPSLRAAFAMVMKAATTERTPYTFDSLLDTVKRREGGDLQAAMIEQILATASFAGTTAADFRASIEAVALAHRRVLLIGALTSAADAIDRGREEEAESRLSAALDRLASTDRSTPCLRVGETVDEAKARYDRAAAGLVPPGIQTGFARVDAMTGGIMPEHVWLVAAGPSEGKTATAKEISYRAALDGYAVMYVTLEMARHEIELLHHVRHANAAIGGVTVPIRGVIGGSLTPEQADLYKAAIDDFSKVDLTIWAPEEASMQAIARRLAAIRAVRKLDLVVIDYLQLVRWEGRSSNQQEEMIEVLRAVKRMARRLKVGVVACWQMKREGIIEAKERGFYLKQDLSGTAEAERTADVIIWTLLTKDSSELREIKIGIAKGRHGGEFPEGYPVAFMPQISTMKEHEFDAQYG